MRAGTTLWVVVLIFGFVPGLAWQAAAQTTTSPVVAPSIRGTNSGTTPKSGPISGSDSGAEVSGALSASLFGPVAGVGPSTNVIFGSEATQLRTLEVGNLLYKSNNADGIAAQKRTPVASDVRIRGSRAGQNIGSGSLWNPGRQDLDTALNKIFSYNIDRLTLIKGPYSVRMGPGFNFVDMEFQKAPISSTPGWGGMTSVDYDTNGEIFYGRQQVWGGDGDWGARVNYGHGTGNDYEDGLGVTLPSSFKSRDLFVSLGRRLDDDRHLEFSYIRLDQTDVEFPGLVYDINALVTDGFELEYDDRSGTMADRFFGEVWYNRTRFDGDTLRPGKNTQIPQLQTTFFSPDGISGFAVTDVDGSSLGGRWMWTWEQQCAEFTVGTDVLYIDQTLNDIEPFLPPTDNNFPIPHSNAWDIGFFADYTRIVTSQLTVEAGARADVMNTRSSEYTEGVPVPASLLKNSGLDQDFTMWSAFMTGRYDVNTNWSFSLGGGFAQRPPTLTELYADQSFIGTLQQGLTFVDGDPLLQSEKLRQIDASVDWSSQNVRASLNGFYSWIEDYITYDLVSPADPEFGLVNGVTFVNTDLATLSGFEANGEMDLTSALTGFGKISFVEGRDHTREKGARQLGGLLRSNVFGDHEPLPGIMPMQTILGLRLKDPTCNHWGVDFNARVVSNQDRVATSLQEVETPGFTTYDLRTYWQLSSRVVFYAGVENLTDKFYQEHLDYRTGLGVYRRGRSFYFGTDVSF